MTAPALIFAGMQIYKYNSLDSTNTKAGELLAKGISVPAAVCAVTQTKGRGKPGKSWYDTSGNSLLVSFILPMNRPPHHYSFIAGIALHRLLAGYGLSCSLRWVNDIYCRQKKLAGILCETAHRNDGSYIVTGIGLNVSETAFPHSISGTSVLLQNPELRLAPKDLVLPLAKELQTTCKLQFSEILSEWQMNMLYINSIAAIESGGNIYKGRILGLDSEGRLLLEDGSGIRALYSGSFIELP